MNQKEEVLDINFRYLEANTCEIMADDQEERQIIRTAFDYDLQDIVNTPKESELDEGWIYYRWYYSDDSEDYGIVPLRNGPRIRWLLYTTGLQNPGMFFYSINQQDLAINPAAGLPRIGPYAPPVPAKGSLVTNNLIWYARKKLRKDFDYQVAVANDTAKKNNDTGAGKIYCTWHFTDMVIPTVHPVIPLNNTQAIRDLLTENMVRYPNQFYVSCDEQDMALRVIDGVNRPERGVPLPTGVGPSTVDATAPASTAGTGQTHDAPSATGSPATKKHKSNAGTAKPAIHFFDLTDTLDTLGSTAGTGSTHHASGMPKSTPEATASKPPTPPGSTKPKVIYLVPTDNGQELMQVDRLGPDASLSSAANPIPSVYLGGTDAHIIPPDSGIAGTSAADTLEDIDPSKLTDQVFATLPAVSDYSDYSSVSSTDSDFSISEFLTFGAVPTDSTAKAEDETEGQE